MFPPLLSDQAPHRVFLTLTFRRRQVSLAVFIYDSQRTTIGIEEPITSVGADRCFVETCFDRDYPKCSRRCCLIRRRTECF